MIRGFIVNTMTFLIVTLAFSVSFELIIDRPTQQQTSRRWWNWETLKSRGLSWRPASEVDFAFVARRQKSEKQVSHSFRRIRRQSVVRLAYDKLDVGHHRAVASRSCAVSSVKGILNPESWMNYARRREERRNDCEEMPALGHRRRRRRRSTITALLFSIATFSASPPHSSPPPTFPLVLVRWRRCLCIRAGWTMTMQRRIERHRRRCGLSLSYWVPSNF